MIKEFEYIKNELNNLKALLNNDYKTLYHGTNEVFEEFNKNSFFSEDKDFSENYGKVTEYKMNIKNIFNTLDERNIKELLQRVNLEKKYDISDYDDTEINNLNDYEEESNYHADTWETVENSYYNSFMENEYEATLITEGGIINYIIVEPNKHILKTEEEIKTNIMNNLKKVKYKGNDKNIVALIKELKKNGFEIPSNIKITSNIKRGM